MGFLYQMVQAEDPIEVVLFLTRGEKTISYPRLDQLYLINGWANVLDNYGLLMLVKQMRIDGLIVHKGGGLSRGPNWRKPVFKEGAKYFVD